jgi:hypothetical protein
VPPPGGPWLEEPEIARMRSTVGQTAALVSAMLKWPAIRVSLSALRPTGSSPIRSSTAHILDQRTVNLLTDMFAITIVRRITSPIRSYYA